ncbi:glutamate receptor ionotropic, delta-1-like [Palaemon carinicauda]|uniref:glutamate receptor ionotropic, delta-1-like n=1 Tax=Palaemon carinicauda TaxID=392227 RepID=UPI0035B5907F
MNEGEEISQMMMTIGKRITTNELTINNILVFLPSPNTVLRPPEYRLNYCILQVKGDGVEFKEVFTFGPTSTISAEEVVGWWSPDNANETFIPFRGDLAVPRDFQGNVVKIAMFEVMPHFTFKKTLNGKFETNGYLAELCHLIAKELNFTIEWVETLDGEFGIPGDDGSFTGAVGMLQRKEADLTAVSLNINIERAKVIDFSPPVDYAYAKLLIYRGQEKGGIDWKTYVHGFHWGVWLSVLGIWFLMSVGLVFVAKQDLEVTVYNYLFTFIGTLAQQGSSYEPQCTRGRIVFLSFWLASVLIYASYTASLTSELAVVNTVNPFSTLKEALTTAGYSVAMQKGTSYYTNIKNMAKRDESMRLLYHQFLDKPHLLVPGNSEGIELVQQGKYAFFQDTVSVNYDIKNNCSFSFLGPAYFSEFGSMGYMKNLSYANVISELSCKFALLQIYQTKHTVLLTSPPFVYISVCSPRCRLHCQTAAEPGRDMALQEFPISSNLKDFHDQNISPLRNRLSLLQDHDSGHLQVIQCGSRFVTDSALSLASIISEDMTNCVEVMSRVGSITNAVIASQEKDVPIVNADWTLQVVLECWQEKPHKCDRRAAARDDKVQRNFDAHTRPLSSLNVIMCYVRTITSYTQYPVPVKFPTLVSPIVRATDSGIARKLMKKWMGRKASCESGSFTNLGFSKTVSAFSLLAIGLVLGAVLLLVEMWVHSGRLFQSRERHSRRGLNEVQIKIHPYDFSLRHQIS